MLDLVNKTPFAVAMVPALDKDGAEYLVVVTKATFDVSRTRGVSIAERQVPVARVDEHFGDVGTSSVRYESDGALRKPGVDVALVGSAFGPSSGVSQLEVELRVGAGRKVLRVFGPRVWTRASPASWRPSRPGRISSVALRWENAFGGVDTSHTDPSLHEGETRNPIGTGFVARQSSWNPEGQFLPQLEDPAEPIEQLGDRPRPVGFGFAARSWAPRAALAGTYDDAWRGERAPLLPLDFDDRHYLGAPFPLAAGALAAGQPIVATHALPGGGAFETQVPKLAVEVTLESGARAASHRAQLDTLIVEPELGRILLTYRASFPLRRRMLDIDRVRVREVAA